MKFIGRSKDLAFLEKCYAAPRAQLVVVYGRRRVGKTECLRQFARNKSCVWYSCTKDTDAIQLRRFSRRLLEQDADAPRYLDSFPSWQDALEHIARLSHDGRKLVIIDEFPYAAEGNRALPSILQNVWDELLSQEDVMLVLCGSSVGFMEDDLLGEKNPLYGRATGVWHMKPMDFCEAAEFFPAYTVQQKLEAYGILGGVPHYLLQFDDGRTIGENVCENILEPGCALHTEVEFLLRQELRELAVYHSLLHAVGCGETELNGIAHKALLDPRVADTYLKKLMSLRIVERSFSVDAGRQEQAKRTRGLWGVCDNFIAFWHAAVHPWQSELDSGASSTVWARFIEPRLNALLSKPFETVCQQWLRRQNAAGNLPFFYRSMGRWWHKAHEIDAVALGENGEHLLAECKFKNHPVGPGVLEELRRKEAEHFSGGQGRLWLFSKNGYSDTGAWGRGEPSVRLVEAEELETP